MANELSMILGTCRKLLYESGAEKEEEEQRSAFCLVEQYYTLIKLNFAIIGLKDNR